MRDVIFAASNRNQKCDVQDNDYMAACVYIHDIIMAGPGSSSEEAEQTGCQQIGQFFILSPGHKNEKMAITPDRSH